MLSCRSSARLLLHVSASKQDRVGLTVVRSGSILYLAVQFSTSSWTWSGYICERLLSCRWMFGAVYISMVLPLLLCGIQFCIALDPCPFDWANGHASASAVWLMMVAQPVSNLSIDVLMTLHQRFPVGGHAQFSRVCGDMFTLLGLSESFVSQQVGRALERCLSLD